MKIHHLTQEQFLPVTLAAAWSFFSDPRNLESITPSRLKFRIVSITIERSVYEGQIIHYRIQIFPFLSVTWVTEITKVKDFQYFIDDQRIGPYSFWHHQHHFVEVAGGVLMKDAVSYAVPLGWLGSIAHAMFVGRQLRSIFQHRREVLERMFANKEHATVVNTEV